MISLKCGISKKDTNEIICKTEERLTDIENKLTATNGEREGNKSGEWD